MSISCDFESATSRHGATDPDPGQTLLTPRPEASGVQAQKATDDIRSLAGRIGDPRPRVSVIIPTYNREHVVQDAIRSILAQTFVDFEVIVVDDGSTDSTASAVRAIKDPRVRLVRHARNRGIPQARNTGLDQARGEYIAWLDSDDVARPDRLQAQVRYLAEHPSVAMVGSCAGKLGPKGARKWGARVPPLGSSDVGAWLLFRSAFQQSSVTGRADVLKRYPYREAYPVCEDVDVFIRLHKSHRIENLPRVLIDRRIHRDQTVRVQKEMTRRCTMNLLAEPLRALGISFSEEDLRRHAGLAAGSWEGSRPDRGFLEWADAWMRRLRDANVRSRYVDADGLRLATSVFWLRACLGAVPRIGLGGSAKIFAASPLSTGLVSRHALNWLRYCLPLLLAGGAGGP